MPREIADSDDDIDQFSDAQPENDSSIPAIGTDPPNGLSSRIVPPGNEVSFSQFLSQSQSYNGFASSNPPTQADPLPQQRYEVQNESQSPTQPFSTGVYFNQNATAHEKSTGSTERVRREIEQIQREFFENDTSLDFSKDSERMTESSVSLADHGSKKRKRIHTDDSAPSSQQSTLSRGRGRKKKTYADRQRSQSKSTSSFKSLAFEASELNTSQDKITPMFIDPTRLQDGAYDPTALATAPVTAPGNEQTILPVYRNGVLTVESSVGGHQTLTITDPNHNPFTEETALLPGVIDHSARIAEIFRPFQQKTLMENVNATIQPAGDVARIEGEPMQEHSPNSRVQKDKLSSSQQGCSTDDGSCLRDPPTPSVMRSRPELTLPQPQRKKDQNPSVADYVPAKSVQEDKDGQTETLEVPMQPKKRGRKPKSKITATREENADSNVKNSVKEASVSCDKLIDTSPIKNPSSEVNLSDEAFIGLPKDQYVPRPSRYGRRASKKVEQEQTEKADNLEALSQSSMKSRDTELTGDQEESMLPPPPKRNNKRQPRKTKGRKGRMKASEGETESAIGDEDDKSSLSKEKVVHVALKEEDQFQEEPDKAGLDDLDKQKQEDDVLGKQIEVQETSEVVVEIATAREDQDQRQGQNSGRNSPATMDEEPKSRKKRGRTRKKSPEPAVDEKSLAQDTDHEPEVEKIEQGQESLPAAPSAKKSGRLPLKSKSANVPTTAPELKSSTKSDRAYLSTVEPDPDLDRTETKNPHPRPSSPRVEQPANDTSTGSHDAPISTNSLKTPSTTTNSSSNDIGIRYRVGLSKRARIPSLLSRVRRDTSTPAAPPPHSSSKKK